MSWFKKKIRIRKKSFNPSHISRKTRDSVTYPYGFGLNNAAKYLPKKLREAIRHPSRTLKKLGMKSNPVASTNTAISAPVSRQTVGTTGFHRYT